MPKKRGRAKSPHLHYWSKIETKLLPLLILTVCSSFLECIFLVFINKWFFFIKFQSYSSGFRTNSMYCFISDEDWTEMISCIHHVSHSKDFPSFDGFRNWNDSLLETETILETLLEDLTWCNSFSNGTYKVLDMNSSTFTDQQRKYSIWKIGLLTCSTVLMMYKWICLLQIKLWRLRSSGTEHTRPEPDQTEPNGVAPNGTKL